VTASSDMLKSSLIGEVEADWVASGKGKEEVFLGSLVFTSVALLLYVWFWEAKYAPIGIDNTIKIYTPKSSLDFKVENINTVYI